jgi:hypothetical protein
MPDLEYIHCEREQVLWTLMSLDHVFFPDKGVVSAWRSGQTAVIEMATIGREGCTAVQAAVGAKVLPSGFSSRSPATRRKCHVRRSGHGVDAVLPKSDVRLRPSLLDGPVSVACNGAHSLKRTSALAAHDA